MNKLLKYLIYSSILSLMIGPLGAIPLGIPQVNVYFTDIIVGLICLIWITNFRQAIKLIKTDPIAKYFCVFVSIAVISLIFSPINMNLGEKLISGLYIVRLFSYLFLYLTVQYLTDSSVSLRLLTSIGLILAVIGWLQYFLYPDLRNLYYLGWDPHFKRIFSTYLDPNYFGLVMVLTLILLFELDGLPYGTRLVENYYLKTSRLSRSNVGIARRIISFSLLIFIFITLMFTYSRSSFLALIAAVIYFSIVKRRFKLLVGILLLFLISALLLPRPGGVGVQLERVFSIETRIENWQQAFKVFMDHPILGVGFNTIRYAKNAYNFGQDNLFDNHAGAGFDNSFLFIAATTGLVGLLSYLFFLRQVFQKVNVWVKTCLIAIIVHSFFLNSLFLAWVMMWFWIVVATSKENKI